RSCRETRVRHIRRAVVYRWHPTKMNAPAEAFRCQALAKEIAAELRAKYDLKAACLPVNVCLLRSSIMIRAAPWEVSAQALQLADRRAPGALAACVPPSHRSASCNAGASPTIQRSRRDRDNEAILSRAVHPEWRTGGAVGRKIAAASRRDHLPCGPLQAARGLQRSGLC